MIFNCLHCGKEKKGYPSAANKYCNAQCQADYEYLKYIDDWKAGLVSGTKGTKTIQTSNYIHRYIREKFKNKCTECGQVETHNGKPLTLQLEHVDGNSSHNDEDNLSLLCPNCHTQTEFYGSKNKGNGRGSIGKRGCNSVVECQPSKLFVAGSIPVTRSRNYGKISRNS